MAEPETPQRGDTWVHRSNSAVVCLVAGRSEGWVTVLSASSFVDGRADYPIALFLRNFKLEMRP